jgi:hypothetical protein
MKSLFNRYFFLLSGFTLVMLLLTKLATGALNSFFELPFKYGGIYMMTFYLVSIISGYMVISAVEKRGAVLVRAIMGSIIAKFFFYIIILSAFVLSVDGHAKEIGAFFFFFYLAFTVFEKTFLVRELSTNDQPSE